VGSEAQASVPLAVADLDQLDATSCAEALAPLFEGAPRFLARLVAARPFGDPETLFARARELAHAMPEPDQVELIDAHPRLGAAPRTVSALSFREQGYGRDADEAASDAETAPPVEDAAVEAEHERVAEELARLNDAYERRFGFRYCVFVAGRPRASLLPAMEASLGADRGSELHRALDAVIDVAADRHRALGPG
jgi:2-oxo-4-hydroxy-4-carboxy-5-ureidoimidazoline decarboxylase